MSNDQKEAKLKASTTDFVGPLLKRLELAKQQVPKNSETEKVIDQISTDIVNTKVIIDDIGNWGKELIGYFGEIERQIDYWVDHNKMTEWDETVRANLINVHNRLSRNIIVNPPKVGTKPREKASDLPQKATITEVGESSNKSNQEHEFSMDNEFPMSSYMRFLDSLAIFPENTELKKRFLIYWWTGLRLLPPRRYKGYKSIEEYCEYVFSELVNKGLLIPVHIRKHNQVVDRYTIKLEIHKRLIFEGRDYEVLSQKREEGTWHLYGSQQLKSGLLNLDQRYLNSKDIMDISSKNRLSAVQLGSWHYTKTDVHNGVEEEHIEVDETDFLKKLGRKVTYLSLQGISRIEELHESIGKLENLIILDLRSCHNLDTLSQRQRSTMKPKFRKRVLPLENMFEKLMVLDISECYLLDIMPKWICKLHNLEVLKGFVVGSVGNQSCQLDDLSNLTKLRKLSIRIGSKRLASENLSGLKPLNKLLMLTIIWGENKSNCVMPTFSFPKNLEKLDIRCYPEAEASKLVNAVKLKNLKRLYIRGGKLTEIPYSDNWEVEILRLRFLENLETDWDEIKRSFKYLRYVEYVECPKLMNFPKDSCRWIKEKDENFQSDNDSDAENETNNQSWRIFKGR
ncbi:disease resistance RPP13-like protein 4 isoform X2 [Carex rostrata]